MTYAFWGQLYSAHEGCSVDISIGHSYQIVRNGKPSWVRVIGPAKTPGHWFCETFNTGELIDVPEAVFSIGEGIEANRCGRLKSVLIWRDSAG